jgi:digeranylgeranylglycerophospholipid reductase
LDADVVIIGAGPAGGNAGRLLSSAGLRVHILEMRSRIGHPVQCGEAISEFALRDNSVEPGDWIVRHVRGVAVHSPSGEVAYVPVRGYCVDRAAFDLHLVQDAQASGARLTTRCRVAASLRDGAGWKVVTPQGTIRARYVIAADGPRSPTATALGLVASSSSHVGLQYKFPARRIDVEEDWLHLYLSEAYGGGYAWIFPRDRVVSVGVDVREDAKRHLHAFCRSLGLDIGDRLETNGGLIPVRHRLKRLGVDGLMVVGDAAGATNPIFGGGIHAALSTARMAAECVIAGSDGEPTEASRAYDRQAARSPFFHPVLPFMAGRLHSATDEELDLAVEVFRSRNDPLKLTHKIPRFLRRRSLIPRALEMPLLVKALRLTITYGW